MVDPRVVEKPRDDEKTEVDSKVPRYIPCLRGNTFNEGKKDAIKKQGKEEIDLPGTFLKTLKASLRRGKRKRWRKHS